MKTLLSRPTLDLTNATHIVATIRNMAQPHRHRQITFRIDTTTIDTIIPRHHLTAIGLTPTGTRAYQCEEGALEQVDVTSVQLEIDDKIAGAAVVMGDEDGEAVLGRVLLESVGIAVDPRNQELKRLPFVILR